MNKSKRNSSVATKSTSFDVSKNPTDVVDLIAKQEPKPLQSINFANAMQGIEMSLATEILNEANGRIINYSSEPHRLILKISDISPSSSSKKLIETIETLIAVKTKILEIIS